MPKVPVTVWTTPNCVQCMMTKKKLDSHAIIYTVEDLTDAKNAQALADFKDQGLIAAPIVTTDIKTWSGFKPGKIDSLASYIHSMEK